MITKEIKIEKKEATEYDPLPENVYQVELLDVNSEENETYDSKMGKTEEKQFETVLKFQYTILAGKDKKGDNLRGRNIWDNYIPTYLYISKKNGKNKLYKIIESLLGRELTDQEEANGISGEFLNQLIGKQLRVGTKNVEKNDKIYTKVETYYAVDAELNSLTNEEKEKATVKNKDEKVQGEELINDEIDPENIPFD